MSTEAGEIAAAKRRHRSPTEIAAQLDAARKRREAAAARERELRAQLRHAVRGADRRMETQRLCAIGGLVLVLAKRAAPADVRLVQYLRAYLAEHPPHDSNAAALAGTPLDLAQPWPSQIVEEAGRC